MMEAIDDRLLRFLDTAEDLLSLVAHENTILMEKGGLTFEAYLAHKVSLMRKFESQAERLLSNISSVREHSSKQLMLEEIRKVRDALKVNSAFHLELIRQGSTVVTHSAAADGKMQESSCH